MKHDQSKRETDWRGGQSLELAEAATEGTAHDGQIIVYSKNQEKETE